VSAPHDLRTYASLPPHQRRDDHSSGVPDQPATLPRPSA
jgi:hypothetical protein